MSEQMNDRIPPETCPACGAKVISIRQGHEWGCTRHDCGYWDRKSKEQPAPSPGGEPVTPRLKELFPALLEERERQGIAQYGRSLETWNGRSAFRDLIEELVDACQYSLQLEMERADLARWFGEALELARDAIDMANTSPTVTDKQFQALERREATLLEKARKLEVKPFSWLQENGQRRAAD